MKFSEQLNLYIEAIDCSAKELANESHISEAVISRYRKDERIPKYKSKQLEALIKGLVKIANDKNIKDLNENIIRTNLEKTIENEKIDFETFRNNLNIIINTLNINVADAARYIGYDASYLSKIKSGTRRPQNLSDFATAMCKYIVYNYNDSLSKEKVANLLNIDINKLDNDNNYSILLNKWMANNTFKEERLIDNFLIKLDEFDLNEYIKAIKFDKIKVLSLPLELPKNKTYYGLKGFKDAQIDALKAIVLSKSKEDIFFYSNMSMIEASKDLDFTKNFMIGLAFILKKGLNLNMVHNLDRPFKELLLGLEGWIPLYMTGQITPYYFKNNSNIIFSQIKCIGGSVALSGEAITGNIESAKLYLTKKQEDVKIYKDNAKVLLKKASPLMNIYTSINKDEFDKHLKQTSNLDGMRRNILTTLPNYVLNAAFIKKILSKNKIDSNLEKIIIKKINEEKQNVMKILENNKIIDEITILSKDEFNNSNYHLSLSNQFLDLNVKYTYEDYLEHLKMLDQFKSNNKNYSYKNNSKNIFNNINIYILENKQVIISKEKSPTIHFVIYHSTLVDAIAHFEVPIVED